MLAINFTAFMFLSVIAVVLIGLPLNAAFLRGEKWELNLSHKISFIQKFGLLWLSYPNSYYSPEGEEWLEEEHSSC